MWIPVGEGRWDWDADDMRHLLLLVGTDFREYFGDDTTAIIFWYRAPADGVFDQNWPLERAEHFGSSPVDPLATTDAEAWAALESAVRPS